MSIAPYMAVGLVPLVRGVHARAEIQHNLDHLEDLFAFGCQMAGLDIPVRLVAIPEGALQGFSDEAEDLDHVEYARGIAIDIPGPETERIAAWAKRFGVYAMAQAKARHPEIAERFFPGVPLTREMGEHEALYSNRKIREMLGFKEEHDWRKYVK